MEHYDGDKDLPALRARRRRLGRTFRCERSSAGGRRRDVALVGPSDNQKQVAFLASDVGSDPLRVSVAEWRDDEVWLLESLHSEWYYLYRAVVTASFL